MSKTTPAQNALLRLLATREHFDDGLPVERAHSKTVDGLVRKGLAVVMAD